MQTTRLIRTYGHKHHQRIMLQDLAGTRRENRKTGEKEMMVFLSFALSNENNRWKKKYDKLKLLIDELKIEDSYIIDETTSCYVFYTEHSLEDIMNEVVKIIKVSTDKVILGETWDDFLAKGFEKL